MGRTRKRSTPKRYREGLVEDESEDMAVPTSSGLYSSALTARFTSVCVCVHRLIPYVDSQQTLEKGPRSVFATRRGSLQPSSN